jgi:hypothetical protein
MLDGQRIVFKNFRKDHVVATIGYNLIDLKTFFRMHLDFLFTNIECIVGILIIVIQVCYGGLFNIFYLGIFFFMILVEEAGGSTLWWMITNVLFIFSLEFKYIER